MTPADAYIQAVRLGIHMADRLTQQHELEKGLIMNIPTKHIHADLILERARQDATGETAAGWWHWEFFAYGCLWEVTVHPNWDVDTRYRFTMSDRHPSLVPPKPKLKLVDMGKLPVGTSVQEVRMRLPSRVMTPPFMLDDAPRVSIWERTTQTRTVKVTDLRIAEQKEVTYLGGGECPVPEGLLVEVVLRDGTKYTLSTSVIGWDFKTYTHFRDVIGYRITGLAQGWTDDPSDCTEAV